jgi:protein disulfide-isomerase-like protein
MKAYSVALLALLGSSNAVMLSSKNWEEKTGGKTVFVKFFAPWCGHCKKLKPDWDKLMDEFAESPTALVADVDCTTDGGKPLCDANGVKGYPTLKYGDPSALEDYKGGRDFDSLKKFAEENLKPICSPAYIELCDDEKKAEIKKLQDMPAADLDAAISEKEKAMEKIETDFKNGVADLQSTYQKLMETKDKDLEEIKNSGLGMMKAVKAFASKSAKDEL